MLKEKGLDKMTYLIDLLIDYAGAQKRQLDIFKNKSMVSRQTQKLKQYFKNVPNVYT